MTKRPRNIRRKDIHNPKKPDVHTVRPNRDWRKPTKSESFTYTVYGKQDYLDEDDYPVLFQANEDSDFGFARKVITSQGRERYFVKTGPNGRLYNPVGVQDEWTHNKFRHKAGKEMWEFREVSERVFHFYVNFLRTKNTAWHKNAERENN